MVLHKHVTFYTLIKKSQMKRGSTQDTVVITVSSTVAVFAVMLVITLVSVYCTRRKYRKKMSSNSTASNPENVSQV